MLAYTEEVTSTGAVEAAQKFVAGDAVGAVALWNKIPGHDGKRGATQLPDGKWLIERIDGREPYTLDPGDLLGWLRSLRRFLLFSKRALLH
jgi:hypothetical protein